MDSASFEKEIVSGNKGNESGVYRGVPLREILAAADESILSECSSVTGTASDGFVSVYSMSEITGSDSHCRRLRKGRRTAEKAVGRRQRPAAHRRGGRYLRYQIHTVSEPDRGILKGKRKCDERGNINRIE